MDIDGAMASKKVRRCCFRPSCCWLVMEQEEEKADKMKKKMGKSISHSLRRRDKETYVRVWAWEYLRISKMLSQL